MKTNNEHRLENIKEKEFHDKFIQMFTTINGTDTSSLSGIVYGWDPEFAGRPKEYLTEKEENICVSLIQWLGSPVGWNFLNNCGFVPKK